jgi:hypothetical protein
MADVHAVAGWTPREALDTAMSEPGSETGGALQERRAGAELALEPVVETSAKGAVAGN